mgnify:CR=1 FL=1
MWPTGIDLNEATAVASGIQRAVGRAVAVLMDVSDQASVNQGFEQIVRDLGEVDILVSNSGIQIVNPLHQYR